jgi:hypothetical protein
MTIRFKCPHCQRGLSVKDHLAGKRAPCPACKQVVSIPAAVTATSAAPADIESLAAAALADEPKPAAAVPEDTRTIDFPCPYCDAPLKIGIALAGKQTPCSQCRRIIKVPTPQKVEPKDWRKAGESKLPLGARREDLALQDPLAATAMTRVSAEALLEADALPEARERTTWWQWVRRGIAAAAVLCLLGGGALLLRNYKINKGESHALEQALGYLKGLEKEKQNAGPSAELHRAAAEFYLLKDQSKDADKHLTEARMLLIGTPASTERDAQLIDLALTQADLGGNDDEARKGKRLKADKVYSDHLKKTLENVRSPEARLEALRSVGRKLSARGQAAKAIQLTRDLSFGDDALLQATALVGLEMLSTKEVDGARTQADFARKRYEEAASAAAKDGKARRPPPALIALCLALEQPDKAKALAPDPFNSPEKPGPEALEGYVQGLARKGQIQEAEKLVALEQAPSAMHLRLVIALASGAVESNPAAAADCIQRLAPDAAADAAGRTGQAESVFWLLLRLVRLGVRAGVGKEGLQPLLDAAANLDTALHARMQLEVLRGQLAGSKDKVDESLAQDVDKETLAHALALESIARHNTQHGHNALKNIESWDPESLRPFGYIGVALGLADREK